MKVRGWRVVGYAVAGLVPGVLGVPVLALIAVGGVLSVTRIGLPFLSLVLTAVRGLVGVERTLVRRLLGERVAVPPAPPVLRAVQDAASWRAAAFAVIDAPLAVVLFAVAVPVRLYALAALSYPLWFRAVEQDGHAGIGLTGEVPLDTLPRALAVAAGGLALLAAAGWAGRRLCALVRLLARTLLAPVLAEGQLTARIHDLEETRALAVRDSVATLRRIERDLHDGAQARLVAVAMSLTRAKDALEPQRLDAEKARGLVEQSLGNARTALAELRDLVRGIHPPVLDNGLAPALSSLRSDVQSPRLRIGLRMRLADAPRPHESVETIAYFCAAELLANAARHSGADRVEVSAGFDPGTEPGAVRHLVLTVEDNGRGGAVPSSGLRGLAERVRTIDGTLELSSPPGGPTRATVRLPAPLPPSTAPEDSRS